MERTYPLSLFQGLGRDRSIIGRIMTNTNTRKRPTRLARGYAHEFELASAIVSVSEGMALTPSTGPQPELWERRRRRRDEVRSATPAEYADILARAQMSALLLPRATGPVSFVEVNANGGEVYDIIYDDDDDVVKVSAKLSDTEDKAYRFNSSEFIIPTADAYLRTIFTRVDALTGSSFAEVLSRRGMTVLDLQNALTSLLADAVNGDADSEDVAVIKRLTADRIVGVGGYWKTLGDGGIRWYPPTLDADIALVGGSARRDGSGRSLYWSAVLVDGDNPVIEYDIKFRVKFKDGVTKPVKVSATGSPSNIAATISMTLSPVRDEDFARLLR